ncbi:phage gp6-like head-tail connector protein [Anaerosalibacter massiliensis]|uniref:phage gp6-like head-tail connector protein n=1 Tax=Anaerosalibacter massiliensis TaxID=1347392 RepID=UPI0005B2A9D7|nr:phage gp6-like head-tail connector protein [Anaerosalibacter massiliensis]
MLEELKNYLRITWSEEDTELLFLLERGRNYLNRLIGLELDYEKDDLPKELLFNYCRYSYNNSTEYFTQNFHDEILYLQLYEASKDFAEKSDVDDTES